MVTNPITHIKRLNDKDIVVKQSAQKEETISDRSDDEDSDDLGDVFSEIRRAAQNTLASHKEMVVDQKTHNEAETYDLKGKQVNEPNHSDDEDSDNSGELCIDRKVAQETFPPEKEIVFDQNAYKEVGRYAIEGKKVIEPKNNDNKGSDDERSEDEGSDDEASDDEVSDDEGIDDEGSDDEGSDDEGSDDGGSDDEGSNDECSDDEGSHNEGTDDEGSDDGGSDDLGDVFNEGMTGAQETFPPEKEIVFDQNAYKEVEGKNVIEPNNSDDEGSVYEGSNNEGSDNQSSDDEGSGDEGSNTKGSADGSSDDLGDVFNEAMKGSQKLLPPKNEIVIDQNAYKEARRYAIQGKKVIKPNNSDDDGSDDLGDLFIEAMKDVQETFPPPKKIFNKNVYTGARRYYAIKGKTIIEQNNNSDDEYSDDLRDVFNEALNDVQFVQKTFPTKMGIVVDKISYKDIERYAIKGKKVIEPNNSDDEGSDDWGDLLNEAMKDVQETFPPQKEIVVVQDAYEKVGRCSIKGKKMIESNSDDECSDDLEDIFSETIKSAPETFPPQKEIIVDQNSYKAAARYAITGKKIIESNNSDNECSDDLGDVFSEAMKSAQETFPPQKEIIVDQNADKAAGRYGIKGKKVTDANNGDGECSDGLRDVFSEAIKATELLPNNDKSDFWFHVKTESQDKSDVCTTQYIVGQSKETGVKRFMSAKDDEFEDYESHIGRKSKKRKVLKVLNSEHSNLNIIRNSNKVEKGVHIKNEKEQEISNRFILDDQTKDDFLKMFDGHKDDSSNSVQDSVKCDIIEVDGDSENEDGNAETSQLRMSECDKDEEENVSRFEWRSGGRNSNTQLLGDSKYLSDTSIRINRDTTVRTANTGQHHTRKYHNLKRRRKLFKCNQCNYRTVYKEFLMAHVRQHRNPNEMLKCDHCNYQTINKYLHRRHLFLRHNTAGEDRVSLYRCNQCSFQSIYKGSLKVHRFQHIGSEHTFKCDQCSFDTMYKSALNRHLNRHKDPAELNMFKCDQCDFQSIYKYSLKQHIPRHNNHPEKFNRFKCDLCDYQTFRVGILKEHFLKEHFLCHNKPAEDFKCHQCPYQFMNYRALHLHLLWHSWHNNSKDFNLLHKCAQCDYRTIDRSTLNRHILGHEKSAGVNMFKCHCCNFYTIYESVLNRHYLRHIKDPAHV